MLDLIDFLIRLIFGWEEILVTYDQGLYYTVVGVLNNNEIRTKSNVKIQSIRTPGMRVASQSNKSTLYYVYVKKENIHRAAHLVAKEKYKRN